MNATEWNDLLDKTLTRLESEPLADILVDYPAQAEELRPLLLTAESLEALWPVAMPTVEALASGREAFLSQVEQLPAMAVSLPVPMRLKGWITTQLTQLSGSLRISREVKNMNAFLLKTALIVILFFGGAGGTAALSAESLPDSALYPVKLSLEGTRLALTRDSVEKAELNVALAETRLEEITRMILAGKTPDEKLFNRFQNHFDAALQLAAQMPEDAMAGFLVRTRDRIQSQEHDLTRARAQVSGPGAEALDEANGLLARLRLQVEYGLQEPQLFRRQQGRMPEGAPREAGPCEGGGCGPAGDTNQYGPGPGNQGANGEGDGVCTNLDSCGPAGNADQNGPGPANQGANGSGDGDGVCNNLTPCEPAGEANQNGPGAANQGANGAGDGVCNDPANCEPAGEANQNGPEPDLGNENEGQHSHGSATGSHSNQNKSH